MMGMFGMAQVIGARSLGINVLTDKDTKWPPPKLTKTQRQIIDSWSLDVAPAWSTVPLAIAFQVASEHLPATDDKSKMRKGNASQKVYRLRLVLVRAARWNVLAKHADVIVAAIAERHPQVPLQLYDVVTQRADGTLFLYSSKKKQRAASNRFYPSSICSTRLHVCIWVCGRSEGSGFSAVLFARERVCGF